MIWRLNMNNNVRKENDSKKIVTMIIMVCVLMLCTTGATYAYFALSATNTSVAGTAATANLTLAVSKIKPTGTGSEKLVPQYSYNNSTNTLKSAVDANCIDGNNNLVCQVYTIVLTNNSGAFILTADSMTNLKWYKIARGSGTTPTTTYTYPTTTSAYGNLKAYTHLDSARELNAGASYYYVVVVWLEETGEAQTDSGSFSGTISFNSSDGGGLTSTIVGYDDDLDIPS